MQLVQKIYIEAQEITTDMKIKKGSFYFNSKKYEIENGDIKTPKTTTDENHSNKGNKL